MLFSLSYKTYSAESLAPLTCCLSDLLWPPRRSFIPFHFPSLIVSSGSRVLYIARTHTNETEHNIIPQSWRRAFASGFHFAEVLVHYFPSSSHHAHLSVRYVTTGLGLGLGVRCEV